MTSPGRYAASDGSFAKSAGSAAARGGILIAIAVVIGFLLLWQGFDGGDSDASVGDPDPTDSADPTGTDPTGTDPTGTDPTGTDPTGTDPTGTDPTGTDPPTSTPAEPDDPSTIRVAVLNGTGEAGLAKTRGETLGALGYVWLAGNAAGAPVADSRVYFVTGFADEAKLVAEALSGPTTVLDIAPEDPAALEDGTSADAAGANIIVVLGTDTALT